MKKIVTLFAGLGVALGGLTVGAAAPAQAATYINANLPSNTGASNTMNLCAVECIQNIDSSMPVFGKTPAGVQLNWPQYNPGATAQGDTAGVVNWFSPQAGTYKVAVRYSNSTLSNSIGYLKSFNGGYQITKNWAEATPVEVPETSGNLGVFTVLGNVAPPVTDPEPPQVVLGSFYGMLEVYFNGNPVVGSAKVALCQVSCLDNSSAIVNSSTGAQGYPAYASVNASTGAFEFPNVAANTYAVAVNIPNVGNGYLRSNGSVYEIVPSLDQASLITVNGSTSRSFVVEQGSNLPSPNATYSVIARTVQIPGDPIHFSSFRYTISNSTASTRVNVKVIGCGGKVVAETNRSQAGKYTFDVSPRANEMGTNWKLVTTISEPGRANEVSTLNKFTPNWDFSCPKTSNPPVTRPMVPVKVTKWSAKAGKYKTAKVNRKSYITTTKAVKGAKITYRWTLNGKVVDRDRSVKPKKSWRGKNLKVTITVKKPGFKTRTKTINYGKVRR